jgi:maleylpyruvate isomerase
MTMSWAESAAGSMPAGELDSLRGLVTAATQRLLGDSIAVTDDEWHSPSRLPGWTRAHVATHLARQADALSRLTSWARSGKRQEMYASAEQREAEIEQGADRSALELQIDLDTAAEKLEKEFEAVDSGGAWDATVELRGGDQAPTRLLPLARLAEVVLHHVDLDIGFTVEDIDQQTAEWLLEWCARRLRRRSDFPKLQLRSDSGFRLEVGSQGEPVTVGGPSPAILGWLTGRAGNDKLTGAEGITLPSYG